MPSESLMALIENVGLTDQIILANAHLPRYVQWKGALHEVPTNPKAFLKSTLLTSWGKFRLGLEPFVWRGKNASLETLAQFSRRRIGQEATNRLLAPFVSGVWAGDIETLSANDAFPTLVKWERENGSLLKGMLFSRKQSHKSKKKLPKGLLSFPAGLETLTKKCAEKISDELHLNTTVVSVNREGDLWVIKAGQHELKTKKLALALPADGAADLVQGWARSSARALREIPYASLAVLHMAVKDADVLTIPKGFGCLIAPEENGRVLGCLFNSHLFPGRSPDGSFLLTVYMGGARHPDVISQSHTSLMKEAIHVLQPVLGFIRDPELLRLTRYPHAIPHRSSRSNRYA
jgi:protoporphyrinogen/coproporphyrinogen III oxidase